MARLLSQPSLLSAVAPLSHKAGFAGALFENPVDNPADNMGTVPCAQHQEPSSVLRWCMAYSVKVPPAEGFVVVDGAAEADGLGIALLDGADVPASSSAPSSPSPSSSFKSSCALVQVPDGVFPLTK